MPAIAAFMYDFDKTLCTKDMQEYGFIPGLGMSAPEFWREVGEQSLRCGMDPILSYLYMMVTKAGRLGLPVTRPQLNALGSRIELFPGVPEWFSRIDRLGEENGLAIEHYVISSGLKEIIDGTPIAKFFRKIYASEFHYNNAGQADWPAMAVNFTNKTQFLFRINKGALDISDDRINEAVPDGERYIPYSSMVYFGDGMTDVPCMTLVRKYGGHSIAVYGADPRPALRLYHDDRVDFTARADYRPDSELDRIARLIIRQLSISDQLAQGQAAVLRGITR